jgi:hypothetical protein
MRINVICDSGGNILSMMSAPEDGVGLSMPVPPEHQEVELDVAELSNSLDDQEFARRCGSIRERYRVDGARKSLVERDSPGA